MSVNPTADGRRYTQIRISQKIAKTTKAEFKDLLLRLSVFFAFQHLGYDLKSIAERFSFVRYRLCVSLAGMAQPTKEQIENIISGQMQELMEKVPANSGVSAAFYCPSHPYVKRYYNYGRANDRAEMSEHTIIGG